MNSMVWTPSDIKATNMWRFLDFVSKNYQQRFESYDDLHAWSITKPGLFWPSLAEFFKIQWHTPPLEILTAYEHMMDARWFKGASLNYAQALLTAPAEKIALISIDETGFRETLTYGELKILVLRTARGLKALGVEAGDRIAGVMPNVSYTIIAFLASASIGAIWSSCSTDFGADAALDRLGQIEPKVLFVSNAHQYHGKYFDDLPKAKMLGEHIKSIKQIVVCPVSKSSMLLDEIPKAISFEDFMPKEEETEFASLPFDHPLYILFSSGTTGKPKCIMHGAGGVLLQHLKELSLHSNLKDTDNLFFYTTCGWMMWNWMVSALAIGATITLYEGSPTYPSPSRLFKLIDDEQITHFGTSAKFISSIEKEEVNPARDFSLQSLEMILSTGSPLLAPHYDFVYQKIKKEVQLCSISGGTDIVSCFALGNPMLPVYKGELQSLGLGMSVEVFDESGQSIKEARGELVCTKPFPSMPVGFWADKDNALYRKAYFERFKGVWTHGDFAEITNHHGLIIYGRSDATLNPGGVRIGTAEIYRQLELIPEILDALVIGQDWQDDVRIVLFVKLRDGQALDESLKQKICQTIKTHASPRHVPAKILSVQDIPRTINNKIVELAVKQVVHGQPVNNLNSIANPEALAYFENRRELMS